MNGIFVSVIIPTYQDWGRLQTCIDALELQELPQSSFEIIIANNDPDSAVPDDFALPSNAKILEVHQPGSYAARNAGLSIARGEVLAFTDADCIPEPQWISSAVEMFQDRPDIARIAGGVLLFVKDDIWTAAALYDRTYMLQQAQFAADGKAATANAFMRRKVFDAVGPFDAKLFTGGDLEWSTRAQQSGFALEYCPEARVRHPARSSFSEIRRKARRFAGGAIARKRERGSKVIFPQLEKLLIPVRRGVLLLKRQDLTISEAIRVWFVLYAIRVAIVGEQIRLIVFRGNYERK